MAAIRDEYPNLPQEFYGELLAHRVRKQLSLSKWKNRKPYLETILRYFRELRKDEIKCTCIDPAKSLYRKS